MYNVNKEEHPTYGNVITISIEDIGEFTLPFDAVKKARSIKTSWKTSGKIRFLINNQILNIKQVESWSIHEYRELPKCYMCPAILTGKEIFLHAHCREHVFCSQSCADKDYKYYLENLDEEHECDYL